MRRAAQPGERPVQPTWAKGIPAVAADLDRLHREQRTGICDVVAKGAPGEEESHLEAVTLGDAGILDRKRGLALYSGSAIGGRDVVMDVPGEDYRHADTPLAGL